jgi:hypothetical protein
MAEHYTSVAADNRVELRIGINLGHVIVEGDDLYGDGVNIAAPYRSPDVGHLRDRLLLFLPSPRHSHPDPQRIPRQIGERHVLDLDDSDRGGVGAGLGGAGDGLGFGGGDRVPAGELPVDLTGFARPIRFTPAQRAQQCLSARWRVAFGSEPAQDDHGSASGPNYFTL